MRSIRLVLALAVSVTTLRAQPQEDAPAKQPPVGDAVLRQELLDMEKADQSAIAAMMKVFGEKGIAITGGRSITDLKAMAVIADETQKLEKVGKAHRARLKEVVEKHGWPGRTLVGEDGAHAAFLLVQHADADAAFQEKCLRLMEAAPAGEVAGKDVAYLTDRLLVGRGKPQRYGTQLGPDFKPLPIEDEKKVDAHRKKLGLPTLAEYQHAAKAEYDKLLGKPPEKK